MNNQNPEMILHLCFPVYNNMCVVAEHLFFAIGMYHDQAYSHEFREIQTFVNE